MSFCWKVLTRRKVFLTDDLETETFRLSRVLDTFDLTALGVGATLGVGVYVLAGHVAKDLAGPSVILSFLIAAIASFFAGLCYAEFGARVPRAGSAYIYSYVSIGEFVAFIIGWNLILEYIIGSASVARGLSLYLDAMLNNTIKNTFLEIAPIDAPFLSPYFDFFGFAAPVLLGVGLAFGLKQSTSINNVFTIVNLAIVLFVIIAGAFKADIANWNIDPNAIMPSSNVNIGNGGFFPFGFEGTLRGAATCFFGFVGFDCIATTGEEVQNPRRAIPRAILFSLCIIFMAYFGVSTVLTLMWPYYLQDVDAPLPFVFNEIGWWIAKWIVAVGGIIGLFASLFGAMFPLPRIIYAMAQDGLIFRTLGRINPTFKTPIAGTLCAALLTGVMAGIFDLQALVNMLSIGTLLAYTVVAISIMILRFSDNLHDNVAIEIARAMLHNSMEPLEATNLITNRERITTSGFLMQLCNFKCYKNVNRTSKMVVGVLVILYCLTSIALGLTITYGRTELQEMDVTMISWAGSLAVIMIVLLIAISVQPRENSTTAFTVPLVPLIPGISIFVNICLMLMLDVYTWIRFGIWMGIGLLMFIACVYAESMEGVKNKGMLAAKRTPKEDHQTNNTNGNGKIVPSLIETQFIQNNEIADQQMAIVKPIESMKHISSANPELIENDLANQYDSVVQTKYAKSEGSVGDDLPKEDIITNIVSSHSSGIDEIKDESSDKSDTTKSERDSVASFNRSIDYSTDQTNPKYTTADIDTVNVLAILDDIIKTVDNSPQSIRRSSNVSSSGNELRTSSTVNPQVHYHTEYDDHNFIDQGNSNMFKDKLSALLIQQTMPSRMINKRQLTRPTTGSSEGKEFKFLPVRLSKSESDLRSLLFNENQEYNVENTNTSQQLPQNEPTTVAEVMTISIPPPPIFNAELFHSTTPIISTIPMFNNPNAQILANQRPLLKSTHGLVKVEKSKEPSNEPDDNETTHSIAALKKRLEKILSRGPPDLIKPRPFSISIDIKPSQDDSQPSTQEDSTRASLDSSFPVTGSENEPPSSPGPKLNANGPFDTVHKQRALFENVLKSINPETKPSSVAVRNETKFIKLNRPMAIASNAIVSARNRLRHIDQLNSATFKT